MDILSRLRKTVHKQAAHIACNNPLYNWTLGGTRPEKLLLSPADPWPGNAEHGRWLVQGGLFELHGDQLELYGENWNPVGIEPAWFDHLHGFDWLRDLRALGGDQGRKAARAMMESWIHHYWQWDEETWRADLLGKRIANWIAAYDFYGESAGEEFQELFFDSLVRQLRHLGRALPGNLHGLKLLYAIKGLAYGGLALEGREAYLEQALGLLHEEIDAQILSDGGHVSRSPQQLLESVQILMDIRSALGQGQYPCPPVLQHALDRAVPALRFFRHGDRRFATFHGSQKGDEELLKSIFMQTGSKARTLKGLPRTGFERMACGKSLVMVDTGTAPAHPYDETAHASPLAFEMGYGRERIFVSCGSHPTCSDWQTALRNTSAHNTLTIDDRNACEIDGEGHISRGPKKIIVSREDKRGTSLVEACHDGYVPVNGITHRRRLYLSDQGHDFRGEETLTCGIGLQRAHNICLRFHLHSAALVSLVKDGQEALIRLRSGTGWRFTQSGGSLSLENSVYLGNGPRPRKTKQLVITGQMTTDLLQLKWALQRESV